MSDDKKINRGAGKAQESPEENYEFYYLEEKLGVTREEVLAAIKEVGKDRHLVEGYLRTHKKEE